MSEAAGRAGASALIEIKQRGIQGWVGGNRGMIGVARRRQTEVQCVDCAIRTRAICALCDQAELAQLERIKSYRSFAPGETIAWAGERMALVGSVVEGVATLSSTLPDGRRQMVGLLLPSDFIGRPGRVRSGYDVVAATPVTLCMFQRPEFERMIQRSPHMERRLLEMTLDELDAAREWMLLLGRKTAGEKIASLFVIMARRDAALNQTQPQDGLTFPLYISREAMADYLGLTIETVSRQISGLRRQGIVRLHDNRVVQVPDFARLLDRSGDDADGGVLA
jgi:CRP/FNR family transcriptional regulator